MVIIQEEDTQSFCSNLIDIARWFQEYWFEHDVTECEGVKCRIQILFSCWIAENRFEGYYKTNLRSPVSDFLGNYTS